MFSLPAYKKHELEIGSTGRGLLRVSRYIHPISTCFSIFAPDIRYCCSQDVEATSMSPPPPPPPLSLAASRRVTDKTLRVGRGYHVLSADGEHVLSASSRKSDRKSAALCNKVSIIVDTAVRRCRYCSEIILHIFNALGFCVGLQL